MSALVAARNPASTQHLFGTPLVHFRMDGAYQRMRRRGRFAISKAEAASFEHLKKAVHDMQEKMVAGLATAGYRYIDNPDDFDEHGKPRPPWEFRGPFQHLVFEDVGTPDTGPVGRPEIERVSDPEAWAKWERAEKARVARRLGLQLEMVDYELVALFEKKVPGAMGVLRTVSR